MEQLRTENHLTEEEVHAFETLTLERLEEHQRRDQASKEFNERFGEEARERRIIFVPHLSDEELPVLPLNNIPEIRIKDEAAYSDLLRFGHYSHALGEPATFSVKRSDPNKTSCWNSGIPYQNEAIRPDPATYKENKLIATGCVDRFTNNSITSDYSDCIFGFYFSGQGTNSVMHILTKYLWSYTCAYEFNPSFNGIVDFLIQLRMFVREIRNGVPTGPVLDQRLEQKTIVMQKSSSPQLSGVVNFRSGIVKHAIPIQLSANSKYLLTIENHVYASGVYANAIAQTRYLHLPYY